MTAARPQSQAFHSSTAGILFSLAEKQLSPDVTPPEKLTKRAACIYARLARLGTDIAERPALHTEKDAIQTNLVITRMRPLTAPAKQVLDANENQVKKLEPEIEAYRQTGLNLEEKKNKIDQVTQAQLHAFFNDIIKSKSMNDMMSSQPIRNGLTSLDEGVQRLKNELDVVKRTGDVLKEKLEVIARATQALEQGTRAIGPTPGMGEQRPRFQE